jgi:hypothetical protein
MKHSSRFILIFCLIFSSIILLTSCGDVGEGAGPETEIQPLIDCELGDADFGEIFEKDLGEDWACLKDTMDVFIRFVETDKPDYLSLDRLFIYIDNQEPDMVEDKPIIESFFKMANLIVGTPEFITGNEDFESVWYKYIHRSDVAKLIDFLRIFNKSAVELNKRFEDETDVRFEQHFTIREEVEKQSHIISDALNKIFNRSKEQDITLDLISFIDTFVTEENRKDLELFKSAVFLKTIFLGGEKTELANRELFYLIERLPKYVTAFYDMIRFQNIKFGSDYRKFQQISKDLSELRKLFAFNELGTKDLFLVDDLITLAGNMVDEIGMDLSKPIFKSSILNVVDILLGTSYKGEDPDAPSSDFSDEREIVRIQEFVYLYENVQKLVRKGVDFHFFYQIYADNMADPGKVSLDITRYKPTTDEEKFNFGEFIRVTSNYRFFNGSNPAPIFDFDYHRNPSAFFEIGALEFAFDMVFSFMERKRPCDEEPYLTDKCTDKKDRPIKENYDSALTLKQIHHLIMDLQPLLVDMGVVINRREQSSANNATLMSDLFQFQSNGKGTVQVSEATEFGIGVFSAISMGDRVLEQMKIACKDEWDYEDPTCPQVDPDTGDLNDEDCDIKVKVSCVRRRFFKEALFSDWTDDDGKVRNYKEYLPKIHEYLSPLENTQTLQMDFVRESELFARTCYEMSKEQVQEHPLIPEMLPGGLDELPSIPMGSGDMLVILGGLLNIESTILKFDTNPNIKRKKPEQFNNNIMDVDEVEYAYDNVYENAIKGLVKASNGALVANLFSKDIFRYIVKFGEVPELKDFLKVLFGKDKKQPADRMTIASILKTISLEQNKLCKPKDVEKEQNKAACQDENNYNPDECECLIQNQSERVRLKHCYPEIFGEI